MLLTKASEMTDFETNLTLIELEFDADLGPNFFSCLEVKRK